MGGARDPRAGRTAVTAVSASGFGDGLTFGLGAARYGQIRGESAPKRSQETYFLANLSKEHITACRVI